MNEIQAVEGQAVVEFSVTKKALAALKRKYKEVPDAATKDGYQLIVSAKRELTPLRTAVEKERTIQVAAALAHQKKVNLLASEITDVIKGIEAPLYLAKKTQDDSVATAKREKEEAEQNRIDVIEDKVTGIQALTENLLGASLTMLEQRLGQAKLVEITEEEYEEFSAPAILVLSQVTSQLEGAVAMAQEQSKEAIELENARAAIAKDREALEDQQRVIAAERKTYEDKVAADEAKAESERQKELRNIEIEKNSKKLAERMPDDIKVRAYAKALVDIEVPEVSDSDMNYVIRQAESMVKRINDYVLSNTQEG